MAEPDWHGGELALSSRKRHNPRIMVPGRHYKSGQDGDQKGEKRHFSGHHRKAVHSMTPTSVKWG